MQKSVQSNSSCFLLPDEVGRPDDGEVLGRHAGLGRVRGDAVEVQHEVVQRPEMTKETSYLKGEYHSLTQRM